MNRALWVAVANYSKIKLYLLVDSLAKQFETTVTSGPIKVIENERRHWVLLRAQDAACAECAAVSPCVLCALCSAHGVAPCRIIDSAQPAIRMVMPNLGAIPAIACCST